MSMFRRFISFLFYIGMLSQSAFAALPSVEAPQSSGGSGLLGQAKGYLQDFIVLAGLVVAAIMFINVAIAAGHTFVEVRNERATWTKFGAIVLVGVVLLVAVIWLLGKSANILL
ncbi:TIGR03745 family integrating conjugative element membrane protein [Pectobacterium cacticida]|uniref:TIGR03745 family integrating conjugative element membrane protein n=1 Tax=Pectobacterium cacticida TaxID=69221 RepID=A0ABZ2G8L3_9GAMM|nr:TIGR03745 family integrating conjugative element membrane protein [Pectobacterium cacticida]UYX07897.1 TIGR03745 family integrating conjugative element membrane protein [Pectobacterium cacticida]